MKIIIKKKLGDEAVKGKFYIDLNTNVFEYSYSPVAGHFDNDTRQLRIREDLIAKITERKE